MTPDPDWLVPEWHAPGVGALMTTRRGGTSAAPFDSLNVRHGIGDSPLAVSANLRLLERVIGARPVFLDQVHGANVVRLRAQACDVSPPQRADASITTEPGVVCAVQVADCLPVLFAAPGAAAVGAAHAGWRGLAAGVLRATVQALCEAAGCTPGELTAWLGACIGPRRFEVGPEVLQAFGARAGETDPARFRACAPGKWLADLPQLARDQLQAAGVLAVSGGAVVHGRGAITVFLVPA